VNPSSIAAGPAKLLADGHLDDALRELSAQVRSRPADAALRVFLFQLLALRGDWERAANQLKVAAELDGQNVPMATAYSFALQGERERHRVMTGAADPTVTGEPAVWHGPLVHSFRALCGGRVEQAMALRERAFDLAGTVAGTIDDEPFEWIADADPRFGPCLELILTTGYWWVPFSQLRSLSFDAPADLRDKIWAPVRIVWRDGAEAVGFVPCRYPGSERASDAGLTLARDTVWNELDTDCFVGCGQRMFVTDTAEYALLDARSMTFGTDGGV
jgi:type VI secretion system protein ImpE